jgi:hypothetical protein
MKKPSSEFVGIKNTLFSRFSKQKHPLQNLLKMKTFA